MTNLRLLAGAIACVVISSVLADEVVVSARDLGEVFSSNKKSAARKYGGKTVVLEGKVTEVQFDKFELPLDRKRHV